MDQANFNGQTDSTNAAKLPYLLALATIEDEKRDNTLTIVRGVLDLDSGKISDNLLTLSLSELIKLKAETKDAPKDSANVPEKADSVPYPGESVPEKPKNVPYPGESVPEKPKNVPKRAVKARKDAEPINTTSEPLKAEKREIPEKLPWEDGAENLLDQEIEL